MALLLGAYPDTRRVETVDVLFGTAVPDPYRWLEDATSPEVQRWMDAEDALTRSTLAAFPGRAAIAERLRALYYVDSVSAPVHRGRRFFYTRTHADKEKPIHYWREGESGPEHVLLDPNTMTPDATTSIGFVVPTWDGQKLAYGLKANNSDETTLEVLDVASGKVRARDRIEGAKYARPAWTPAGDAFYYTWIPPVGGAVTVSDRPGYAEIRRHKLGDDPRKDRVVHEATRDPKSFLGVDLSRDGRWLFAYISHGWNSTDVFYRDLKSKDEAWKPFVAGVEARYSVAVWRDRFYVHTNEGAPRWRLLVADPQKPAREQWKEIVPQAEAVLQSAQIIGERLVLSWLENASNVLEVRGLDGNDARRIALPGLGSLWGVTGNPDEDRAYYGFTSFTQPVKIFETSIKSGTSKLWSEVKLPIDASPYTVDQVFYASKDGTRIPMFLVHRKDLKKDGSTPFYLTGYGGFDISMTPAFSSGLYPWFEAGGAYALPNLRGGGEFGEDWHKAGMGPKKQNVFDDFIAAAEYLVKEGYTRPERLAIRGGSNGGLLVGAALTQRPELFRAVVCQVPLLDMVRYHLFGSGKTWISEYGSADDEAQFKTLYAYSPYHHVKAGTPYPAVLFLSADHDDRVDPMHARKMAAALQAASSSGRPVLIRIEKHAGHGGADLVKQAVEQSADLYAFLMRELGMTAKR